MSLAPAPDHDALEWISSAAPVAYPQALDWMEARAQAIADGRSGECVWLLEHPALYTAGTSADPAELLDSALPVFRAGRGGRYTYHGPGQLVGYVMVDLGRRGRDVRCYVHALEGWLIRALARLGVEGRRAPGRVGIWTRDTNGAEAKVAAIGVRVRRWVAFHGFSINLDPDLAHFGGIVPCGIADRGVTSIARLGGDAGRAAAEQALAAECAAFLADIPLKQSA